MATVITLASWERARERERVSGRSLERGVTCLIAELRLSILAISEADAGRSVDSRPLFPPVHLRSSFYSSSRKNFLLNTILDSFNIRIVFPLLTSQQTLQHVGVKIFRYPKLRECIWGLVLISINQADISSTSMKSPHNSKLQRHFSIWLCTASSEQWPASVSNKSDCNTVYPHSPYLRKSSIIALSIKSLIVI